MKKVAIVGCGPRGLASLENLMILGSQKWGEPTIQLLVFEPSEHPGAGEVWQLNQVDSNWLNISDRALKGLKGREEITFNTFSIPGFPSFLEWMEQHFNYVVKEKEDRFPSRSKMGNYLYERFESIAAVLIKEEVLDLRDTKVLEIEYEENQLIVHDENDDRFQCDECLITIGHQSTYDDEQIKAWKTHCSKGHGILFDHPYAEGINDHTHANDAVALRGFGLAMIDIARLLTIERGASFEKEFDTHFLKYGPSNNSVKKIVAFSLDGLPMVPKPIGNITDQFFTPSDEQKHTFQNELNQALRNVDELKDLEFLLNPFIEVSSQIYLNHPSIDSNLGLQEIKTVSKKWLSNMSFKHNLIQETTLSTLEYMKRTVAMSLGEDSVSLDFCVGQVWRHLQPIMYSEFSHCGLSEELTEEVIALDESTKRYSYGPPTESILQLIALSEADVLDLKFVNDPQIQLVDNGWKFESGEESIEVDVMINSVLDAPKLTEIDSSLILTLKKNELLNPVTNELGVNTSKNGLVELENENNEICLSMLGRNCKGSILGVDAILECFGERIKDWAEGVIERLDRKF